MSETDKSSQRPLTNTTVRYATLLLKELYAASEMVPAEDLAVHGYPGHRGETVRVFRGILYKAGEKAGLSKSAMQVGAGLLVAMQAITVLQRASPFNPSLVLLSYIPTEEQYEQYRENVQATSRYIRPNKYTELKTLIETLTARVTELERLSQVQAAALLKIQDRRMLGGD